MKTKPVKDIDSPAKFAFTYEENSDYNGLITFNAFKKTAKEFSEENRELISKMFENGLQVQLYSPVPEKLFPIGSDADRPIKCELCSKKNSK
ncbi:MAG: hypothetical protein ABEJ95_02555 [Candidatus Nanohalobium sp.]